MREAYQMGKPTNKVTTTFPVGAFLTGEEYRIFQQAVQKTKQETGQAVRFACLFWARIAMGGDENTDENKTPNGHS